MALQIIPDGPSSGMSPTRISFSHDLLQNDVDPVEPYIRSSSTADFDFCILRDRVQSSSADDFDFCILRDRVQSSSADELFSDGKILAIEIKRTSSPPKAAAAAPPPPPPQIQKSTESKVPVSDKSPFRRFKRSSSLNCGSGGYARSLCPLPRSNSSGSNSQKQSLLKCSSSAKQSSPGGHQKPPLKKSSHGYYSRVSPILNVPLPPANMFGLRFMFSGGKKK